MIHNLEIGDDGIVRFFNKDGKELKLTEAQKQTALLTQIWSMQHTGLQTMAFMEREKLDS